MKKTIWFLAPAALGLVGWATVSAATSGDDDDANEETLALDAVPAAVLTAARNAVPGMTLVRAERENEGGEVVYSLEGTANGRKCEVEVSADGKVLEVEDDDDADDDDDDDDDGDDD